jgi:hypothetical protein
MALGERDAARRIPGEKQLKRVVPIVAPVAARRKSRRLLEIAVATSAWLTAFLKGSNNVTLPAVYRLLYRGLSSISGEL